MSRIDPHSYFDTDQPRAKHVRLRWNVDFTTRQINGDATLVFETPSLGKVALDSKGLTIASVRTRTAHPRSEAPARASGPYRRGDDRLPHVAGGDGAAVARACAD